jgi:hypothetical protein
MKRLILASIFGMMFAVVASAQEKPQLQLIAPEKLLELPSLVNPSSAKPVHGLGLWKQELMPPSSIELTLTLNPAPSAVCSVPLIEAHVDPRMDPRMAFKPGSTAVPIPQARVPAPSCSKK